jgi:hypothetical protein
MTFERQPRLWDHLVPTFPRAPAATASLAGFFALSQSGERPER